MSKHICVKLKLIPVLTIVTHIDFNTYCFYRSVCVKMYIERKTHWQGSERKYMEVLILCCLEFLVTVQFGIWYILS